MRLFVVVVLALGACNSDGVHHLPDAPPPLDARIDAPLAIDTAPPPDACDPRVLIGGADVAAQGWTTTMMGPATLTYGADYTQLATTTTSNTGGQLLLVLANAVPTTGAFSVTVELAIAGTRHNQFDAAGAILGSFTAPAGTPTERAEMVYVDPTAIGWADDAAQFTPATAIADGAFHTVLLAVAADGTATVSLDGATAVTRTGFTTTGTIAIGDQTNDPNYDGTMQIRSVATSRCSAN